MTFHNVRLLTTIFSVAGAFFAFVAGGWVAARIVRHPARGAGHPARCHRVAGHHPLMLLLAALGANGMWGAWYGGLVASPRLGGDAAHHTGDRRRGSYARSPRSPRCCWASRQRRRCWMASASP